MIRSLLLEIYTKFLGSKFLRRFFMLWGIGYAFLKAERACRLILSEVGISTIFAAVNAGREIARRTKSSDQS